MIVRTLSLLLVSGLAFGAPSFPVLTYSTYLRDSFTPKAIAADSAGNIYMTGNADVDPVTSQSAVLVVKLNPQASQYLYVRYLGGSVNDYANAITVDSAGNAYIAGSTASPDFPVTSGGNLGTPATSATDQRSFVVKLNPNGDLAFSALVGGSAASIAQAVAVNAAGQILVTGTVGGASGSPFPSTAGAYSIANSVNHPWLLELDPTGVKTIFSATGIGGSAIALDSSGNIYVAGTTQLLDYPTTPGTYEPTFPVFSTCYVPCMIEFQGSNQYVTKVDPTGSKLIYSTAVSGSGNTTNSGLALDAGGNVYLTGLAGATYPYTVAAPAITSVGLPGITPTLPFLSKLDPAGQTLLFSVPVGGAGVQVDADGAVYAGGQLGLLGSPGYDVAAGIPALAGVPTQCLPNKLTIKTSAYASQVDSTSGSVLGSQFIGGSTLTTAGVALSASTLWIAAATNMPDFPFTPNALTISNLGPGPLAGAYLGAVDFSQPQPPAGTPQIDCILDAADLAPAGPAVRYQLLAIFGTGLGPALGAIAAGNSTTTLAGVNVGFASVSAPLLYASSTQINFAVPLVPSIESSAVMQLTVNGVTASPRQLPLSYANPSLFLNIPQTFSGSGNSPGFVAAALNADGSVNSSTNPAQLGSAVWVFVNGLTPNPQISSAPLQLYTNNGWSILNVTQSSPFVLAVGLQVPSPLVGNFSCPPPSSLCTASFTIYDVYGGSDGPLVSSTDEAFGGVVYVNRPQ